MVFSSAPPISCTLNGEGRQNILLAAPFMKDVHMMNDEQEFFLSGTAAMVKKRQVVEKRKERRYKAKEGAFTVLPANMKLGQIEDISPAGLSFFYVPLGEPDCESDELEIYFAGDGFQLKNIPFKTVSDYSINEGLSFRYVEKRRYSVKFGELTRFQKVQLDYFIKNYTTYSEK